MVLMCGEIVYSKTSIFRMSGLSGQAFTCGTSVIPCKSKVYITECTLWFKSISLHLPLTLDFFFGNVAVRFCFVKIEDNVCTKLYFYIIQKYLGIVWKQTNIIRGKDLKRTTVSEIGTLLNPFNQVTAREECLKQREEWISRFRLSRLANL